jgi:hypothetical protein
MKKDGLGVFESKFAELVRSVARRRRPVYIDNLGKRLLSSGLSGATLSAVAKAQPWTGISSLSALRALVGGRFANLKERWLAVGFPLKEGRSDGTRVKINRTAWLELVSWIEGQGYSARLPEDGTDSSLLEIRQLRRES